MADMGAMVFGNGVTTAVPEIRKAGNSLVANFTLAFNRRWGKGPDARQETAFIECEAWGWLAEQMERLVEDQFVSKGTKLAIRGLILQKSWQDQEGKKRSKLVLKIEDFGIVPRSSYSNNNAGGNRRAHGDQGAGSGGSGREQPASSGDSGDGPPVNQQKDGGTDGSDDFSQKDIPF